jgi:NADH-quinone oxidoreductase subunit L
MVSLPLILLLPLLGAAFVLLGQILTRRKLPKNLVSVICCGTVLGSFLLAITTLLRLQQPQEVILGSWLPALGADWGFLFDHLSGLFACIITGVGFLIHVYSTGYMKDDAGYARYFGYLNLFVFAMLLLVLANNYVLLFAGWEGVGLASYLLIGFWFDSHAAGKSANKAFIVNRAGDAALMLGIWLIWKEVGSIHLYAFTDAPSRTFFWIPALLMIGAFGKSAQFPLLVWLPDAMVGPTPVSALIHAATMVTAGVYLLARGGFAAPTVAIIGAFTAIFAASIATAQHDIKRVLAWSTISQLGYMFLALGTGAYSIAVWHMLTHAFFKALLFLSAGNVIHALGGEQDLYKMGGLRRHLPKTHALMLIGAAAAAGVPGLAGFFSKDAVLSSAFGTFPILYVVGLITALMTAFYMWRLMYLTFYGEARAHHHHVHEAPMVQLIPMGILAIGAIFAGYWSPVKFLAPALGEARETQAPELILMAVSAAVALGGWLLAKQFYLKPTAPLLQHGYYLDHFYDVVFVRGLALGGSRVLSALDSKVVDGGVNGAGWLARLLGGMSDWWDRWIVDGAVRLTGFFVKMSSYPSRFLQTGSVQFYALIFLGGLLALTGYLFAR